MHAIFTIFYLFFLPVVSRPSFTSRTLNYGGPEGPSILEFFKVTFCKLVIFQFCTFTNMQFINQVLYFYKFAVYQFAFSTPRVRDIQ